MHIALCHDALIPPSKYGGTERIVFWLAKALNSLGHKTTLLARAGSAVPGTETIELKSGVDFESQLPGDVDLLHLWATPWQTPKKSYVVTIEGNGQPSEAFLPNTIFISRKHAENHGATDFVYNGIDPDDYPCSAERGNYAVFLAKASWKVKNLEGALEIARAAGVDLEVMGSRDWPLNIHKLRPKWRGVRYRGMVGDVEKRRILSGAKALLFPVRWHEPFGIAITEALASGCAVLGTPYGSLPEIVTPEVGLLSDNAADLVEALKNSSVFSPALCRARVYQGFTHIDMARAYLKYYEHVLSKGRLAPGESQSPRTKAGFSAQSLLPWRGYV